MEDFSVSVDLVAQVSVSDQQLVQLHQGMLVLPCLCDGQQMALAESSTCCACCLSSLVVYPHTQHLMGLLCV